MTKILFILFKKSLEHLQQLQAITLLIFFRYSSGFSGLKIENVPVCTLNYHSITEIFCPYANESAFLSLSFKMDFHFIFCNNR